MRRLSENPSRWEFNIQDIEDAATHMGLIDFNMDRMVAVKIDNIFRAEDSLM
jgi:hypothetical protein